MPEEVERKARDAKRKYLFISYTYLLRGAESFLRS